MLHCDRIDCETEYSIGESHDLKRTPDVIA
jgi:hypothetical protein